MGGGPGQNGGMFVELVDVAYYYVCVRPWLVQVMSHVLHSFEFRSTSDSLPSSTNLTHFRIIIDLSV